MYHRVSRHFTHIWLIFELAIRLQLGVITFTKVNPIIQDRENDHFNEIRDHK